MAGKECPMCGETMHVRERKSITRVPGAVHTTTTKSREWVCPECDYFEEAEDGGS